MTDWAAVWEHLAIRVMKWHRGSGKDPEYVPNQLRCHDAFYDSKEVFMGWVEDWKPDESFVQYRQVIDAMVDRGWCWKGYEDWDDIAKVEYGCYDSLIVYTGYDYKRDIKKANARAAAGATGYKE